MLELSILQSLEQIISVETRTFSTEFVEKLFMVTKPGRRNFRSKKIQLTRRA